MSETRIRRIREAEGEAVVELWSRMNAAFPDGGPLSARGRRNLRRMLEVAAFHRDTFCLVAETPEGAVAGFAMGHVDTGDGLLPGPVGEAGEVYAPGDDVLAGRLAAAVVARLEEQGCAVLRHLTDVEDEPEQAFWRGLGFTGDMVVMSRYRQSGDCGSGDEER